MISSIKIFENLNIKIFSINFIPLKVINRETNGEKVISQQLLEVT